MGALFTALASERIAHQSGGVFFLRIEDTDKKREVEDGVQKIIKDLQDFGLSINEGITNREGVTLGEYGPYKQSLREDIYQTFVKKLISEGKAYPCFYTSEELGKMREEQESLKLRPGYYGKWAKHRDLSVEEITTRLSRKEEFVIRLRAETDVPEKRVFDDLVKESISVPTNDTDVILLKKDGVPTYHFAHVIDDFLMGTTDVIRSDEWLSSLPTHLNIFGALGWQAPRYGHVSPILKLDNGNKRKLSKRKDPEAAVDYYYTEGYPTTAITEYLLNIANSNFEDWRKENPDLSNREFELVLEKFSKSGALFNVEKLDNISREIISKMTSGEVFDMTYEWAINHNSAFAKTLTDNKEYVLEILTIERGVERPRKDFAKWSEVEDTLTYFFPEKFEKSVTEDYTKQSSSHAREVLEKYMAIHNTEQSRDEWFTALKNMADELGFASNMKEYKNASENFKGSIADVAMILRIALTGKQQAPDLYQIMKVMGVQKTQSRINFFLNRL